MFARVANLGSHRRVRRGNVLSGRRENAVRDSEAERTGQARYRGEDGRVAICERLADQNAM